ncbi:Xaa-Pro peptidase family protein [Nisaea sp.]|uniref:M24 family metallopeptidase n=1 Tax=Nisaea sp. TaxID=2024842 RepID=UPI0032653EBC
MSHPALAFSEAEYRVRISRAREQLVARGMDALLCFAQESHYYLTGYDGGGYVFFQCLVLTAEEKPLTLLCRRPDVSQARDTSLIDEIRIWLNAEDTDPANQLRGILSDLGFAGGRVGIELDTYGLTGKNHAAIQAAMDGFCTLVDGSDIVSSLRLVKSETELDYIRKAAALADDAYDSALDTARAGVVDAEVTAAIMTTTLRGGGDVSPAGPLVNSGSRAIYGRGVGGPRPLDAQDLLILEYAGTFRRYNCCIERSISIGGPTEAQRKLHGLVRETLEEMQTAFRPGDTLGTVDDIHRRRLDAAGHAEHRFAACGYSLGATYRPSWMDVPPMIYSGNPLVLEPGMVFFPHVMVGDPETRLAMGLGNTVLVTETGCEVMSRHSLDLPVR